MAFEKKNNETILLVILINVKIRLLHFNISLIRKYSLLNDANA